jgi:hypothetical protein
MKGKPSTSKCQALSVFDDDSTHEAQQKRTDAKRQIYNGSCNRISSRSKEKKKVKKYPQHDSGLQFHQKRTANTGRMRASGS